MTHGQRIALEIKYAQAYRKVYGAAPYASELREMHASELLRETYALNRRVNAPQYA